MPQIVVDLQALRGLLRGQTLAVGLNVPRTSRLSFRPQDPQSKASAARSLRVFLLELRIPGFVFRVFL